MITRKTHFIPNLKFPSIALCTQDPPSSDCGTQEFAEVTCERCKKELTKLRPRDYDNKTTGEEMIKTTLLLFLTVFAACNTPPPVVIDPAPCPSVGVTPIVSATPTPPQPPTGADCTAVVAVGQSIQKAIDDAGPGTTICVRAGTYLEDLRFRKSGKSGSPITLRNFPGERPVIDFQAKAKCSEREITETIAVRRLLFQASEGAKYPIGWIIIDGLELKNGWDGIKMYNAHDIVIRNNHIHHSVTQGIAGNGKDILITDNVITYNGTCRPQANLDHGIYTSGSRHTITNNLIYSNTAYGIQNAAYDYDPASHAGQEYAGARDWLIANNTLAFQWTRPGIVLWKSGSVGNIIENNIFYENSLKKGEVQGISFAGSGPGNTIRGNIFYSPRGLSNWDPGSSGNIFEGNQNIDPGFVDAKNFNFRLMPGSPAAGKGADHD